MPESVTKKGLFAPIESGADAAKIARDAALAFFIVAALHGVIGVTLAPAMLIDAVALAVLAGALMKWRSRAAAVLLLLVSGLQAAVTVLNRLGAEPGGKNVFLAAIMLITAVRAVEATFKLHGRYSTSLRPAD